MGTTTSPSATTEEKYFDESVIAKLTSLQKWQVQVLDWRHSLGCEGAWQVLRPWTSLPDRKYLGFNPTARIMCILDLVTIEVLGGAEATVSVMNKPPNERREVIENTMAGIIVDLSQNPIRRAYTNVRGISKCMTTASQLYAFERDRRILPREQMFWQGHGRNLKIPPSMSPGQLHDLAGVGISLPCLGAIFASLLVTTGF